MPQCDYCESFECESRDDQEYLEHLAHEHMDELSRIDELKVENEWEGSIDSVVNPTGRFSPLMMGAMAAALVFVVGIAVVSAGSGVSDSDNAEMPDSEDNDWIYTQGTIEVTVDGEPVLLDERNTSEEFYVEDGSDIWRMNVPSEERLTVGESLVKLDILSSPAGQVSDDLVDDPSDAEIQITVNGESTDLDASLTDLDDLEVIVQTS